MKDLAKIAGYFLAVVAIASVAQFFVFPLVQTEIARSLVQCGCYVLAAAPAFLYQPVRALFSSATKTHWLIGVASVVAAVIWAAATGQVFGLPLFLNAITAAVAEEVIFRGWIWIHQERFQKSILLVVVNALLFALFHVPAWISQQTEVWQICLVSFLGLLFALLRLWTRTLITPILVHVAIDIASA